MNETPDQLRTRLLAMHDDLPPFNSAQEIIWDRFAASVLRRLAEVNDLTEYSMTAWKDITLKFNYIPHRGKLPGGIARCMELMEDRGLVKLLTGPNGARLVVSTVLTEELLEGLPVALDEAGEDTNEALRQAAIVNIWSTIRESVIPRDAMSRGKVDDN